MSEVRFTVPLTPPSVNHYKARAKNGHWYVTKQATAFKSAIGIFAARQVCEGKRYQLDVTVFLGKGQRGDGDNFWKVIGDGLKEAGVIRSDAAVAAWNMKVDRDPKNPRTEIKVSSL